MRPLLLIVVTTLGFAGSASVVAAQTRRSIKLPAPQTKSAVSLEQAIRQRRTHRDFDKKALPLATIGQLLFAAQGVTSRRGLRTAPSAGAKYPIELYVLTPEGLYRYQPRGHRLWRVTAGDVRPLFWKHVWHRAQVRKAPLVFLFTVVVERTWKKYGRHAQRYVDIEVGHAGQNILLQATALGLWTNPIGGFKKSVTGVARALKLPKHHVPRYVIAVGHPAP